MAAINAINRAIASLMAASNLQILAFIAMGHSGLVAYVRYPYHLQDVSVADRDISILSDKDYLTLMIPHGIRIVFLWLYFFTGLVVHWYYLYYYRPPSSKFPPLRPWRIYFQHIHLFLEVLLMYILSVHYDVPTILITPYLRERWPCSARRIQNCYRCCGFQTTTDMVLPSPPSGPDCSAEGNRTMFLKYEELRNQEIAFCTKDGQTDTSCMEAQWEKGGALAILKRYRHECVKQKRWVCPWDRSCLEPWSAGLRNMVGRLLVVMIVGFVIEVGDRALPPVVEFEADILMVRIIDVLRDEGSALEYCNRCVSHETASGRAGKGGFR
ncbi:MAG: hypothetical protein Q9168_003548 [Polycauliona sp. 1 TL-2023]